MCDAALRKESDLWFWATQGMLAAVVAADAGLVVAAATSAAWRVVRARRQRDFDKLPAYAELVEL